MSDILCCVYAKEQIEKKKKWIVGADSIFFFVWSCQFRSEEWNAVLLTEMALMSLVCPLKVCLQAPSLRSHSLARESQAPEMKVFMSGDRARDMQSPMWLVKITFCLPVSRSHRQLANRGKKSVNPGCEKKNQSSIYRHIRSCFHWGNSPGSVTRSCDNLRVTNETAAWQVPCV